MKRTVQEHIEQLTLKVGEFNEQLMNTKDQVTANQIEADIRALKLTLTHFELALKLEQEVIGG